MSSTPRQWVLHHESEFYTTGASSTRRQRVLHSDSLCTKHFWQSPFFIYILFMGDLHSHVTKQVLYKTFGPICFVQVCRDGKTSLSRGFGYVNLTHRQYARNTLKSSAWARGQTDPYRVGRNWFHSEKKCNHWTWFRGTCEKCVISYIFVVDRTNLKKTESVTFIQSINRESFNFINTLFICIVLLQQHMKISDMSYLKYWNNNIYIFFFCQLNSKWMLEEWSVFLQISPVGKSSFNQNYE